jgi:hypothetical protein
MPAHNSALSFTSRWRLRAFRAFGGILFVLAGLGVIASLVGVFFTVKEASISGWWAPLLVGGIGAASFVMTVVGLRALRIKSVEELEAQSKSKWLEPDA